jgi:hypothetical protein
MPRRGGGGGLIFLMPPLGRYLYIRISAVNAVLTAHAGTGIKTLFIEPLVQISMSQFKKMACSFITSTVSL